MILYIEHEHGDVAVDDVDYAFHWEDELVVVVDGEEYSFENGTIAMAFADEESFEQYGPVTRETESIEEAA